MLPRVDTLVLGMGSNTGDRAAYMSEAIRHIEESSVICPTNIQLSSFYESEALLPDGAPEEWDMAFINAVVSMQSNAEPLSVLHEVKTIEITLGRMDRGRWGPREIDIDILCYGDFLMRLPELTLPHREMLRRDFVMIPFAELHPDWRFEGVRAQDIAKKMHDKTTIRSLSL